MSALLEGCRIGPYRIVRLLGQGGMGAVYEARQESLDRRVALKTLHAEYAQNQEVVSRFFNEAKVLSRLEHPSIVQASDFGNAADGTAYLVMEYLHGQSLGRRLGELARRGERLPTVTALQIAYQVADVLAVAHAQGIVHRDIKPDNLMLVVDTVAPGGERAKVLDFGIAKLSDLQDKGGVKTGTQQMMGTPAYMSPEQCAGAGGVDAKTDVYALGCVLYEALAGRAPFVAMGAGQLIGMHLYQSHPPLLALAPKVPAGVAELVHRMLTKNKDQRPSMTDTADDLAKLLSKLSGSSVMLRSQAQVVAPVDGSRVQAAQPPATTLGRSIGEQNSEVSTSMRRLLGIVTVALALAVIGAVRLGRSSPTNAASPNNATLLPAPPAWSGSLREPPAQPGETVHIEAPKPKAAATSSGATESGPAASNTAAEQGQSPLRTTEEPARGSQPTEPTAGPRKPKHRSKELHSWLDRKKPKSTVQSRTLTSASQRKRIEYEQ